MRTHVIEKTAELARESKYTDETSDEDFLKIDENETLLNDLRDLNVLPKQTKEEKEAWQKKVEAKEHEDILKILIGLGVIKTKEQLDAEADARFFKTDEDIDREDKEFFKTDDEKLKEKDQEKKEQEQQPLTYLLGLLGLLAAAATASPTAINALVMLSGMPIKEVGDNWTAWWNSMSVVKKIFSVVNAFSSEYVNARLVPTFFRKFREKINDLKDFKSPVNIASFILGISGGIAAGAIAYEALAFSLSLAIAFTSFNSVYFFLARFVGVNKVLNRIVNRKTSNIQSTIIDELEHLKANYKTKLEDSLKRYVENLAAGRELNDKDLESIFAMVAEELEKIQKENANCLDEKTREEQAKEILGTIFDVIFAAFVASISLITFTRKTRQGLETLLKYITGDDPFKNLANEQKIPVGILGGLASAMLYGDSALDFRTLMVEACSHLYENPSDIPWFIGDFITNIFGTTGMFNVGAGTPGPTNEFNVPLNPFTHWIFSLGSAAGAMAVNFGPILKTYIDKPDPNNQKKSMLDQVIKHYRHPSVNPVKKETLENFSFFAPKNDRKWRGNTSILNEVYVDNPNNSGHEDKCRGDNSILNEVFVDNPGHEDHKPVNDRKWKG